MRKRLIRREGKSTAWEKPRLRRDLNQGRIREARLAGEELIRAVDDLIQRQGDVRGVLKRMEDMGLGSVARSWVSTSAYEPIFSDQLHALFGTSVLRALAAKLDLPPRDFVRHLSQALPRAVNRLADSGVWR